MENGNINIDLVKKNIILLLYGNNSTDKNWSLIEFENIFNLLDEKELGFLDNLVEKNDLNILSNYLEYLSNKSVLGNISSENQNNIISEENSFSGVSNSTESNNFSENNFTTVSGYEKNNNFSENINFGEENSNKNIKNDLLHTVLEILKIIYNFGEDLFVGTFGKVFLGVIGKSETTFESENYRFKFIFMFFAFILLLGLIIGGFFIYNKKLNLSESEIKADILSNNQESEKSNNEENSSESDEKSVEENNETPVFSGTLESKVEISGDINNNGGTVNIGSINLK